MGSKNWGKWRRGWDVLSLGSKQYKLAHGNRGFKKNGKNGGEGGRFEPWLETIQISPRRPWVQKTGENGGEGGI